MINGGTLQSRNHMDPSEGRGLMELGQCLIEASRCSPGYTQVDAKQPKRFLVVALQGKGRKNRVVVPLSAVSLRSCEPEMRCFVIALNWMQSDGPRSNTERMVARKPGPCIAAVKLCF